MPTVTTWLRFRLIGLVVCVLIAGFSLTNVLSYRDAVRALKDTILHHELPLTGSNIYSEIEADLIRPVFISSQMANDTFVKDWLESGEQDRDRITRYLEAIRRRYGVFTSFLVSEKTRQYYHFSGKLRTVSETDPDDVWYFRDRVMREPYEINIDYDESSNRTVTIFVNYRVLDDAGNLLGITGVGLNIDAVRHIVDRYHDAFQRSVYFVDKSGTITVGSPGAPPTGGNLYQIPGLKSLAARITGTQEGQFEYDRDGEPYLLETRYIPELGWYVFVEQSQGDATQHIWRSFLTNLWVGFGIIFITAGIVAWSISIYQRRLDLMATTDKLTGLSNRQVFDTTLEHLIAGRRRGAQGFAVLLFDIDHFKRVNDSYGHVNGDEAIRKIATATRRLLRKSDLVCRWGGEEMIVLALDCPLEEARRLAETLRAGIRIEPLFDPDEGTRVTISVGVTAFQAGDTMDSILSRVDTALFQAKADGGDRVRVAGVSDKAPEQPTDAAPVHAV
jgi:diguanylate cyclase (GGDEF)-like protein